MARLAWLEKVESPIEHFPLSTFRRLQRASVEKLEALSAFHFPPALLEGHKESGGDRTHGIPGPLSGDRLLGVIWGHHRCEFRCEFPPGIQERPPITRWFAARVDTRMGAARVFISFREISGKSQNLCGGWVSTDREINLGPPSTVLSSLCTTALIICS